MSSCDPDPATPTPVITYPIKYTYKGLDYEKSRYFVVGDNSALQEISAVGNFVYFDAGLKELLAGFIDDDIHIKNIELSSETDGKITFSDNTSENIKYAKNGNILEITIAGTTEKINLNTVS